MPTRSLYSWQKTLTKPHAKREADQDLQAEVARLKRELKRTEQEKDILNEATTVFFANESKNATRS